MKDKNPNSRYDKAFEVIKSTILRSQYMALQKTNAIQLQLYYAIGRYISYNSRDGYWGTGALAYISRKLVEEMPGIRGFSESNLKMMRIFFEQWACLEGSKSSAAADDLKRSITETQNALEINTLEKHKPTKFNFIRFSAGTFFTSYHHFVENKGFAGTLFLYSFVCQRTFVKKCLEDLHFQR